MKIKISNALKRKKKLAAEIADLGNKIQQKNSYDSINDVSANYNTNDMMTKYLSKKGELVVLKTAINTANIAIQETIYNLSEAKATLSFLKRIPTTEGVQNGYGEARTYVSQITEIAKDNMINDTVDLADRLQEEIDTFNYTTFITL